MSATESAAKPDVSQLNEQSLPEAPFPGGRSDEYRVFIEPQVHAGVWRHATENGAVEICGVLVGRWVHDAAGPYAHVNAFIHGDEATNKFAEITFTDETWARINQQMDAEYADQAIVGWYRSHPDGGIFLSDRDRFIQEHFFAGAGQVAYVVDPVRQTEGMFAWRQGEPALAPRYWVGDRVQVSTPAGEARSMPGPKGGGAASASPGPAPARGPARAFGWLDRLSKISMYVLVFVIGFLLAGNVTHTLNNAERYRLAREVRTQTMVDLNARVGLGEELDALQANLTAGLKESGELASQHLKLLGNPKEMRDKWQAALNRIAVVAGAIPKLRIAYALTPDETAHVLQLLGARKSGDVKGDKATEKKGDPPAKTDEKAPEQIKK